MKKGRYTEEQIIGMLKEWESGLATGEVARKYGVCENTLYRWKSKYGDMEVSDAKKLKRLEEENRRLKTMVADLLLDNKVLKDINSKNW